MTVAPERLDLELGALAKPLSEQLAAQGMAFDVETVRHLELDAQAISRLKVRGVLTYTAGNRLYDKIFKSVWAEARRAGPAESGLSDLAAKPTTAALATDEPNLPNPPSGREKL